MFLEFLKKLFSTTPKDFPGVLDTPETLSKIPIMSHIEVLKEWPGIFGGIFLGGEPDWREKKQSEWKKYPIKDQDGSSACVWFAVAKVLGMENEIEEGEYVDLAPRSGYRFRVNYPELGSYFPDVLDFVSDKGLSLEFLVPSNGKNETQMNDVSDIKISDKQIARIFRAGGFVSIDPADINTMAKLVDIGKGLVMGFRFTRDEWQNVPVVKNNLRTLGHGVAGVDRTLWKSKDKSIIMDESWGIGTAMEGQRVITETFLKERCFFCAYLLPKRNDWRDVPLPVYDGTTGSLQACLIYEKLLIIDKPTGYFGPLTANAIKGLQKRYNLTVTGTLTPEVEQLLKKIYK